MTLYGMILKVITSIFISPLALGMILKVITSISISPLAIKLCKNHSGYRIGAFFKFFQYDENLNTSRVNLKY